MRWFVGFCLLLIGLCGFRDFGFDVAVWFDCLLVFVLFAWKFVLSVVSAIVCD